MTDREALIILNALLLGTRTIGKILEHYSSPKDIFSSKTKPLLPAKNLSSEAIDTLKNWEKHFDLHKELELVKKHNISVVTRYDEVYPQRLNEIYDPPYVLYVKGALSKSDNCSFAMVGSRRASLYGLQSAEKLAFQIASIGATVVSGMARGIDASSHTGALRAGGRSIAVLGNGLSAPYPPENKKLFSELSEKGAVLSEFPMKMPPLRYNFPRRNRIISGLSLGVLVVEAAKKSGSLITAEYAMEYGRPVFALPGRIDSALSHGVNDLLKDGACLVSSIDDIVSEIPELQDVKKRCAGTPSRKQPPAVLSETEKKLFGAICNEPKLCDEIVLETALPVGQAAHALLSLEMKKFIKQLPGKRYIRN